MRFLQDQNLQLEYRRLTSAKRQLARRASLKDQLPAERQILGQFAQKGVGDIAVDETLLRKARIPEGAGVVEKSG